MFIQLKKASPCLNMGASTSISGMTGQLDGTAVGDWADSWMFHQLYLFYKMELCSKQFIFLRDKNRICMINCFTEKVSLLLAKHKLIAGNVTQSISYWNDPYNNNDNNNNNTYSAFYLPCTDAFHGLTHSMLIALTFYFDSFTKMFNERIQLYERKSTLKKILTGLLFFCCCCFRDGFLRCSHFF